MFIAGPMFSGKSTRLLEYASKAAASHQRVIILKHSADDRYVGRQLTHDDQQVPEEILMYRVPSALRDARIDVTSKFDFIGIDEGHFFDDIVRTAEAWAY